MRMAEEKKALRSDSAVAYSAAPNRCPASAVWTVLPFPKRFTGGDLGRASVFQ